MGRAGALTPARSLAYGLVELGLEPGVDVRLPVDDAAAELGGLRASALRAPEPEGVDRDAGLLFDVLDSERSVHLDS